MAKKKEAKVSALSCYCGKSIGFPLVVLLLGLYLLARDLGWITTRVSFWAVLLILVGVYWLIGYFYNKTC